MIRPTMNEYFQSKNWLLVIKYHIWNFLYDYIMQNGSVGAENKRNIENLAGVMGLLSKHASSEAIRYIDVRKLLNYKSHISNHWYIY